MIAIDQDSYIKDLCLQHPLVEAGTNQSPFSAFSSIATKLFNEYQIAKGKIKYDLEEVEFYLYTNEHRDNKHVYPRECNAGEWFVHYSGVDLTFKTLKEGERITQCGGILIRGIKQIDGKSIGGPLRCMMELLNGPDAPKLVKRDIYAIRSFISTPRIGIVTDKVQDRNPYRFVVEGLAEKKETLTPLYHGEDIIVKEKKYNYSPKYEK